ncbi:MAG: D-alanine--D-alanine ligase [Candidatus Coatesbacteria bacterium]|nr:MAG: D-alanine--D-alanine ligase [Candidatus Coatesbacteria bacterium]
MGKGKIRLAVLFGGRSGEHEISVISARSMLDAVDPARYEIIPIYITSDGRWFYWEGFATGGPPPDDTFTAYVPVTDPTASAFLRSAGGEHELQVDVVFPLLHGPYGEDGTVQGLLEMAGVPYVGSGVLGCSLAMDKAMSKTVMRAEGIPTVDFVALDRETYENDGAKIVERIESAVGYPIFVKPANLGSSIGITKVHKRDDLGPALDDAFKYDSKAICEQGVAGRELECSVLGNLEPEAAEVGELRPTREFYDYEAKYVTEDTELVIPAPITPETRERVRELAVKSFLVHDCRGLARVDFFYVEDKDIVLVNELNTMPGFTPISMYPKLWDAIGLNYSELIGKLVALAFENSEDRKRNQIKYSAAVRI